MLPARSPFDRASFVICGAERAALIDAAGAA